MGTVWGILAAMPRKSRPDPSLVREQPCLQDPSGHVRRPPFASLHRPRTKGPRQLFHNRNRPNPSFGTAGAVAMYAGDEAWFERELSGCKFPDTRLKKRLRTLVAQIGRRWPSTIERSRRRGIACAESATCRRLRCSACSRTSRRTGAPTRDTRLPPGHGPGVLLAMRPVRSTRSRVTVWL